MANIDEFVAEARLPGDAGERAAAALAQRGAAAVGPLVAALRNSPPEQELRFSQALTRVTDAHALPSLAPLIEDPDTPVALAALGAIARSSAPDALNVLRDALASSFRTERIIEAIGELRAPGSADLLRAQLAQLSSDPTSPAGLQQLVRSAEKEGDLTPLSLLIELATAFAKLGDHHLAPAAILLSAYGYDDESGDALLLRIRAVQALKLLTGRGVFAALVAALHDPSGEVRAIAMRALLLLGSKEAVRPLIEVLAAGGEDAALAYSTIHELVGEWPDGRELLEETRVDRVERWWQKREPSFAAATCYRLGKPASLAVLIDQLDRSGVASPLDELRIVTGVDFELAADLKLLAAGVPDAVAQTARAWLAQAGARFVPGRLYKYGHERSLAETLQPR